MTPFSVQYHDLNKHVFKTKTIFLEKLHIISFMTKCPKNKISGAKHTHHENILP